MYSEKFDYPNVINESTGDGGRVYFIRHNDIDYKGLYSVTTILSKMSDTKKAIQAWRDTVGHEHADFITNKSINIGNNMHDILHHRMIETPNHEKLFRQNFLYTLGKALADKIEKTYIVPHLDEAWGAEVPLFIPNLYAGRTDLVGVYKGIPSIIDYKNAYKEKKLEHMENYFIQSAAYATAHDYLFNTDITQAVILIGNSTDITVQEIILDGHIFQHYKNRWLDMLNSFFG